MNHNIFFTLMSISTSGILSAGTVSVLLLKPGTGGESESTSDDDILAQVSDDTDTSESDDSSDDSDSQEDDEDEYGEDSNDDNIDLSNDLDSQSDLSEEQQQQQSETPEQEEVTEDTIEQISESEIKPTPTNTDSNSNNIISTLSQDQQNRLKKELEDEEKESEEEYTETTPVEKLLVSEDSNADSLNSAKASELETKVKLDFNTKKVQISSLNHPDTKPIYDRSLNNYTAGVRYYEGMFLHKLSQKIFNYLKLKSKNKEQLEKHQNVVTGLNDGTTPNKPDGATEIDNGGSFKDVCTQKIKAQFGTDLTSDLKEYVIQDQKSRLCFLGAKFQSRDRYTYPGILSYGHATSFEDASGLPFGLGNRTNFSLGKSFYNGHLKDKKESENVDFEQEMETGFKTTKISILLGMDDYIGNPTIAEFLSGEGVPKNQRTKN